MKLVFMGTPDFAVPCLQSLVDAGHEIALVVSQPDKVRGRGRKAVPSPVRALAMELGIATAVLEKGARKELYQQILSLQPELVVVVAFGHIIREPLLRGAKHGCMNLHASLLPRWRGPAPIHRSIVAGDTETGVCTMVLEEGVDTGDLYLSSSTEIGPNETTASLHDRLAQMGAELLVESVTGLNENKLQAKPQASEGSCHAAMLSKYEGSVDFSKDALEVHNRIRGLHPWPGTCVLHNGKKLKLSASQCLQSEGELGLAGTILKLDKEGVEIACETGSVMISFLQPEGKKAMAASAYANGYGLETGQVFESLPGFK